MANMGRDKIWTPEIWADIDQTVLAEVGRLRVAQKVFPAQQKPEAPNVSADVFDPATMTIQEGITLPFIEIWVEFPLAKGQADNEATLHTGKTLSRLAARSVALAEDLLFFQGSGAALPQGVRTGNLASAGNGLLGLRTPPNPIPVLRPPAAQARRAVGGQQAQAAQPAAAPAVGGYGEGTFTAVTQGMAALIAAGHPGPYALFLESTLYADAFAPMQYTLTTAADRISPLMEGRFYGTGTLPANTGLLTSLGGDPTTIYIAQEAITAFTQEDQQGNFRFRVFERVQIVAREPQAFVVLQFQ